MTTKKESNDPGGETHRKRLTSPLLSPLPTPYSAPCPSLPVKSQLSFQNPSGSYFFQETFPSSMLEALSLCDYSVLFVYLLKQYCSYSHIAISSFKC